MKKIILSIPVLVIFLSGCFGPKYIPAEYFNTKHTMSVTVHNLPDFTHSEVDSHRYERDPEEKLRKGLAETKYTLNQYKVFSQIPKEEIKKELEADLEKRINKIFPVNQNGKDLAVEVKITSWGWIIPPESYLISGSYQLFFNGDVEVFDVQAAKKSIAHSSFRTRENISDHLSLSETKRAINKAAGEAAELVSEFLWRSDAKEQK